MDLAMMSELRCARSSPDALDATCTLRGERFSLRAGPVSYRAGAGSWARAEGAEVTVREEPIYGKNTPEARTWRFTAKDAAEAAADVQALNGFLEGTPPEVHVSVPASRLTGLKSIAPLALLVVLLFVAWLFARSRRATRHV